MKAVWPPLVMGALAAAACRFGGPSGDPSMLIDLPPSDLPPSDAATEASDGPVGDATGDATAEATGASDATPDGPRPGDEDAPDATPDGPRAGDEDGEADAACSPPCP
jgi:hypothetical protein